MTGAVLLTMTNSLPGREQEFEDWYGSRHLSDLVSVPAVTRGVLHTATDVRPAKWRQCAVYDLAGDPVAALDQVFDYGKAGKMAPAEAIDRASSLMAIATPITERIGAKPDPDNHLFVVLTNPREGQEEEYNRWYNGRHVEDVLALPGFLGVQRFRLSHHPTMPKPHWDYLAFYEVDRTKVAEAFRRLDADRGTERMPTSKALKSEDNEVGVYRPVSTKVQPSYA